MSINRPESLIRTVLLNGRRDLWNASLPSYLCPVRDYLLDPAFLFWIAILPPMGEVFPNTDLPMALLLTIVPLAPLRIVLGVVQTVNQSIKCANGIARQEDLAKSKSANGLLPLIVAPPTDTSSSVRGGFAFLCSACADLIGALINPRKMEKWMSSLRQFRSYLHASGVGAKLEESIVKPLYHGRLLDNIKILNDIQETKDFDRASRGHDPNLLKDKDNDLQTKLENGTRLVRFATAAYGTEMIRAAIDETATMEELDTERKAIAFHTKIDPNDVRLIYDLDDCGDMKALRHYIAVDHAHQEVILAIRGTLSISCALVDMQAMECKFCHGHAHTGIADIANALWEECGSHVQRILDEGNHNGYTLVITGHSLGAGVACLFHMKMYTENLLPNRHVKCYGFAPPPTFRFDDDSGCNHTNEEGVADTVRRARDNCTCYVHDNDCVPFLSVPSIERLAVLLDTVDNHTEHMWFWNRWCVFWEWIPIPDSIVEAVVAAGVIGKKTATDRRELMIPAGVVIWMQTQKSRTLEKKNYKAFCCSPDVVAARNIFMCNDMVTDHLPEMYEDALDCLAPIE